jgi:hypothetical protein
MKLQLTGNCTKCVILRNIRMLYLSFYLPACVISETIQQVPTKLDIAVSLTMV